MPETNRLQTCMARKDLGKGPERDLSLLELYVPSRNTGQGDCCYGELNLLQREGEGKPNLRIFSFEKRGNGSERVLSHGSKARNRTI